MRFFLPYKFKESSLKKWKKPSFKSTLYVFLLLLSVWILFNTTELSLNQSESFPQKIFLIIKGVPFKKGDLIAIKGHPTKYYPNITFIKRVVGFPEDKVTYQGTSFFLNGTYGGEVLRETSFGEPLTPLKTSIIPDGYFFVKADHARSFDSRYQEFGLIKEERIIGKACVLW